MATPTANEHPFAPQPLPDRAMLDAYLKGQLGPEEAHRVELAMEQDPLLQEAMEGLQHPEATKALAGLAQHRPHDNGRPGAGKGPWFVGGAILGMVLLAGGWLVVSPLLEPRPEKAAPVAHDVTGEGSQMLQDTPPDVPDAATVAASVEQPETLRIGHRAEERPLPPLPEPALPREAGPQPMEQLRSLPSGSERGKPAPLKGNLTSRKLLFLHDLKLVHPDELYPYSADVDPGALSVAARYRDRKEEATSTEPQRTMRYADFMDGALGKFARGDHKGCLEDLRFLLEQYPDDVNATFYAGLCSYNLALYRNARRLLHRAATHPVDSFEEEATWYHALTLLRLGEEEAAREALERIAERNGFYAQPARDQLKGDAPGYRAP